MYDHEHDEEDMDFSAPLDIAEPQRPAEGWNDATLMAFKSRTQEPKYAPGTEVKVYLAEFKFVWESDEGHPCEAIETRWLDIKHPKMGRRDADFLATLVEGVVQGGSIVSPGGGKLTDPRTRVGTVFSIRVGHNKNDPGKWYMNEIKEI